MGKEHPSHGGLREELRRIQLSTPPLVAGRSRRLSTDSPPPLVEGWLSCDSRLCSCVDRRAERHSGDSRQDAGDDHLAAAKVRRGPRERDTGHQSHLFEKQMSDKL